jgi:hypothetical protein
MAARGAGTGSSGTYSRIRPRLFNANLTGQRNPCPDLAYPAADRQASPSPNVYFIIHCAESRVKIRPDAVPPEILLCFSIRLIDLFFSFL